MHNWEITFTDGTSTVIYANAIQGAQYQATLLAAERRTGVESVTHTQKRTTVFDPTGMSN